MKAKPKRPPPAAQPLPHEVAGLTAAQYEFCLAYLANGFNATAAYKASHPDAAQETAEVNACRTLRITKVAEYIRPRMTEHWKALQMDGEEALARVALDARSDPRQLFDESGQTRNPKDWPDDFANSVEAVEVKEDGAIKVKLASKLTARRIILEQTGKLKSPIAEGFDALAAAIREDLEAHKK